LCIDFGKSLDFLVWPDFYEEVNFKREKGWPIKSEKNPTPSDALRMGFFVDVSILIVRVTARLQSLRELFV